MKPYEIEMLLQSPRHAAVAELGEGNVSRIVPVAWPLLRSEWDVIVSVSESIGLVDRFVLRALRDFGPCTVEELDAMLCLGEDRTAAALEEMIRVGAPIRRSRSKYSVPEETDVESFQTEHEHRFTFLLNGFTGGFLPTSLHDRTKRAVLSEEDLEEMSWIVPLRPILSGSESPSLRGLDPAKVLRASDADGIPIGFKRLASDVPRRESLQFVLGFLFIDMSGNGLLLAATESADEIAFPAGYLSGIPRLQEFLAPVPDAALRESNSVGILFHRADPDRNVLSVAISDIAALAKSGDGTKPDFAHFVSGRLLRPGWFWNRTPQPGPMQFAYFDLRAANADMERTLLVEKTVGALAAAADDLSGREAFSGWLAQFLASLGVPDSVWDNPAFAHDVLEALKSRKDGRLFALANRIADDSGRRKEDGGRSAEIRPAGRTFLSSSDETFGRKIVDLIRNAEKSVFVVSPVVEEEEVFEALRETAARNVDVRVVTQLGNHRTGEFKTSPEFADYDIPRRKLADLGARVRDWDVTVHAKMVLADDRRFLFTTANLNGNSLGTGERNAVEAAFLFEDGPEVAAGRKLFDAIWEGCPTRQEKRDDSIVIARVASKVRAPAAADCSVRAGAAEFLLSTPANLLLSRRIAVLLDSAKKNVLLLAMTLYDLEKVPALFDAFVRTLKRNVKVTVLVRPGAEQNFKPSEWPDPSTKKLMALGLKVVEIPRLHAKGVFVDDRIGLMTSANLNPYSLGDLETSHVEVAVQAPCGESIVSEFRTFAASLEKGGIHQRGERKNAKS